MLLHLKDFFTPKQANLFSISQEKWQKWGNTHWKVNIILSIINEIILCTLIFILGIALRVQIEESLSKIKWLQHVTLTWKVQKYQNGTGVANVESTQSECQTVKTDSFYL